MRCSMMGNRKLVPRNSDVKNRPPTEDVDEMTAERRRDGRPEGLGEVRQAQGEATFVGGEGAVQNTHAERRDGAPSDALEGAEEDQRLHVPGQPAERRAGDEEERGEDKQTLRPHPCPQPADGGYHDRLDDLEGS